MYRIFIVAMVIIALAAVAAISGTALAQNQTSSNMPANGTATNATLDSIREQYLAEWNRTEFNATFSTFVEPFSAAGYGVYEVHDNVFEPGETIVLYVEPVGFDHMPVLDEQGNNTMYLMNMTADYTISDSNGTELQTIQDVPVGSIASHRQNTELFLELTLTQESPFPAGDYLITYLVTDEVSGESFELEKEITVGDSAPSSVA